MKKVKTIGFAMLFLAISIAAFASVPNHCDDMNVVNVMDDAPHPFWGTSVVATYGYTDEAGCVHTVNCERKYRFWISFGTTAVDGGIAYCN